MVHASHANALCLQSDTRDDFFIRESEGDENDDGVGEVKQGLAGRQAGRQAVVLLSCYSNLEKRDQSCTIPLSSNQIEHWSRT